METVGLRLKHLRKLTGLSQLNFAKAIGLSQGRLSDIETNQNKPSADTLISVMEFFNASADWILRGIGPIYNPSAQQIKDSLTKEAPLIRAEIQCSDADFLHLIHQLNEAERHYIFNFIQFTLNNRYAHLNTNQSNS